MTRTRLSVSSRPALLGSVVLGSLALAACTSTPLGSNQGSAATQNATPMVTAEQPLNPYAKTVVESEAKARGGQPMAMFSQASLPAAIQVPAGNRVAWETVGVGEITYECRDKANMPGQTEWFFVGPKATLNDRMGKAVGRYWGPPATWAALDGSQVTATQLATAPAGAGNLPYQLVQANPAMGAGAMTGVTYIQRVALKGGVAPATACTAANKGARQIVPYQADYIFWKAA
ncbi:uncharacterized protein DUF3455 [Comamonas sp. BIGb0124]|uniref:DUF3455 domain-containing protein n=1 Tax=Comamonas sp. BIGb0124 TaxID=2485130 RepID=UPI000F9324BF|nr:DUF3455 domain-containing protein [Comamonas sp. BIGb0124]ROR20876.1 uncharacterized protein DUF3455 [Comamonas sp. BIGb0124]